MNITVEINGQTFKLGSDPKPGDLALLDWTGRFNEYDLRYGECINAGEEFILMKNQYNNDSHATLSRFPNAKWYKLTLL